MIDILATLREATRQEHQAIEGVVPLLRDGLTLAEYADHLAALHAWLVPVERAVSRELASHADLVAPHRLRAGRIERDLADLHRPLGPEATEPWIPRLGDKARAAGTLYVLEGSKLGGRVILRRLSGRLPIDAEHGGRWLAGDGDHAGPEWASFRAALAAFHAKRGETSAIVEGALGAFRSLREWLASGERAA